MLSRIISSVENPQRHFNFEPAKIPPPPPPIVPSHRSPSFAYPPSSSSPALIHPLFSLGRRRRKFALNLSNGWVEEGQIANKRDIYIYILQIDIGRNASRISVDRVDIDGDGSISMGAISWAGKKTVGYGMENKRTTRFHSDAVAAAFIDIQRNLRGR